MCAGSMLITRISIIITTTTTAAAISVINCDY